MSSIFFTDKDNNKVEFDVIPVMPAMKDWRLQVNVHYSGMIKGKAIHVEVPMGFITDFASIPLLLQPIVGKPTGRHGVAAVVHDYGYAHNRYDQETWDMIMLDIMKLSGVGWLRRNTIYYGLRVGGFVAWNKYRRKDAKALA
jgi:hypothetical protein